MDLRIRYLVSWFVITIALIGLALFTFGFLLRHVWDLCGEVWFSIFTTNSDCFVGLTILFLLFVAAFVCHIRTRSI